MEENTLEIDSLSELERMEFYEFHINTSNAYHLANIHQDDTDIPHKNLVDFRERLEEVLPRNAQPSAKFHPLHWEYHKNKYIRWEREKKFWRMEDSSVFNPFFFMSDARISGEISYHSLPEEEKKVVDDSTREKGEINWIRWAYDAYTLWDNCPLTYEKHEEDFEFFFAWQLLLTDLLKIKKFLYWHLRNTFQNNLEDFKDFIEIMYVKYDTILFREKNHKVVFNLLEKMEVDSAIPQMTTTEIIETTISKPKSKKKNIIEIPITLERGNTDTYTKLTVSQTVILFDYLSQTESILSEERHHEYLKKVNKAKAIQALTGYKSGQITDAMEANFQKKKPANVREVRKIIENIKLLIDNDLK